MKNSVFSYLISLLLLSCSAGEKKGSDKKSVSGFEGLKTLKGAVISGYVVDAENGNVIASSNPGTRMTPASLSKIFTTSATLYSLGPDYRYETVIAKTGKVVNGRLSGDLVVIGGGDPTLGSKYFKTTAPDVIFKKILKDIRYAGIKNISGNLVVVSDWFSPPAYPSLRLWEDMSNYYGAPPASLTFMDNTFKVTLKSPAKTGQLCSITDMYPDPGIKMDCRVMSSTSNRDSAYIYGYPGLKEWYIDGSIPAGRNRFVVKGALPFPEKVFGKMLVSFLKKNGISVNGLIFKYSGSTGQYDTISTIKSPPLSEIIKEVNKKSINLFADHLFLTLAKSTGKANWDNARKAFDKYWEGHIGENNIFLHDGSGLSPFNHCTPKDMVKVLRFNAKNKYSREFRSSLSVSGVDGTLRRIWRSEETKGHVTGKSGYMKGVLGYAGYITTKSQKQFVFCIIVNRFTEPVSHVRGLIEKEIEKIIVEN